VDHSKNTDFVEAGWVNGGVSLTEMRVDEEEIIVGKKDDIPSTTSLEGQSATNVVDHSKNNDFVEVGRVNGGMSLTETSRQREDNCWKEG
jgi:hypothetical protein